MKTIKYAIIAVAFCSIAACQNEDLDYSQSRDSCVDIHNLKKNGYIKMNFHNTEFSLYEEENDNLKTKAASVLRDSIWSESFGRTIYAEASEPMILDNVDYYYLGALFVGSFLENGIPKTITTNIKPVSVSISLPLKNVTGVISQPSISTTRQFVADILQQENVGEQIAGLSYSIQKFEVYDELQLAYESGKNVNSLFFSGPPTSSGYIHKIGRSTGLYVKFIQKNFTVDMDYPSGGSLINGSLSGTQTEGYDPVYINSITYGRMGILAIETDLVYDEANQYVNEIFSKLFVKKETSVSTEAQRMMNSSTMNLLLAGTNTNASAIPVTGYDDFVNYINGGGKFSKNNFGVPISFRMCYLSDNSTANQKFEINISTDPLYTRIEYRNCTNGNVLPGILGNRSSTADLYLAFYSDKYGKNKTIPLKFIEFSMRQKFYTYIYTSNSQTGKITENDKLNEIMEYKYRNPFKESEFLITKGFYYSIESGNGSGAYVYEYKDNYLNHIMNASPYYKSILPLKPNRLRWPDGIY